MGVPAYNTFEAQVTEEDGKIYASFGKTKLLVAQSVVDRFVDMSIVNGRKVKLGIAPEEMKTEPQEGYNKIKAEVDFCDDYPRFRAVYSNIVGKDNYNIAKHSLSDFPESGKELTYYVNPEKLMFFDLATDEKLVAFSPITANKGLAKVTKNAKGDVVMNIGTAIHFVFHDADDKFKTGTYPVYIDFKAFSVSKEVMIKNPTMVISLPVGDADNLGNHTVVYGTFGGFDTYMTAMFDGTPPVSIGDRLKIAIDPKGIIPIYQPEDQKEE
jgi:hypothetical protein